MADITITAANVVKSTAAVTASGTAGATITAGQLLYKDTSDSDKLKLAQHDGTAIEATIAGVALHGASSGQPITYQTSGLITIGATTVAGTVYVASATAGGIAPDADAGAGDYKSILGVATTTAAIQIQINNSGTQI